MSEIDAALQHLRTTAERGLGIDAAATPLDRQQLVERLAGDRLEGARVLDLGAEQREFPGAASMSREPDGAFDVIHCGDLERERDPLALLMRIEELLAPDGIVLVGAALLSNPDHSQLARFARGTDGVWWLHGRLTFRRLVETAGFAVLEESPLLDGPGDLVHGYLLARSA